MRIKSLFYFGDYFFARALAKVWKADIIRDFKNEIEYIDGDKHGKKRPKFDQQNFYDQIDYYADSFVDEWLLENGKKGVTNAEEFREHYENVDKIHHKLMSKYRQKMAAYVESKRSNI